MIPVAGVIAGSHHHVTRAVGDAVASGQPLVTLEAMKMEHVVAAPSAGRLVDLSVAAGDQVTRGQLLAVVRAEK